jgi:hypothetical protein
VNGNEPTALVIEHTIERENQPRYENWLKEILEAVSASPGYLGREVFPATGDELTYTTIVRFQANQDLERWLDSPERKAFIEKVHDAFEGGDRTSVRAGIDVWFTPPNSTNKPQPYKQFLITAAAIYPLSLLVPRLLSPLFEAVPFLGHPLASGLIVTSIIVGLMTYVVMPYVTQLLRNWLFKSARQNE